MEFMNLEDQELLREEILTLLGLTHAPENKVHRVDMSNLGNRTVQTSLHRRKLIRLSSNKGMFGSSHGRFLTSCSTSIIP